MVKDQRNATDAIWLLLQNYRVVPLNPRLRGHTVELERAIRQGTSAHPDLRRRDFYDVDVKGAWAYIHVRDDAKTVYLVAHSGAASSNLSRTAGSKN